MLIFFRSVKNIFKHFYESRSFPATHKHQTKIFHLVFSVFIFFLPVFVLLPLLFKICPAFSAEMPGKGQHSNFLVVEKSGDFVEVRSSGSLEDPEGGEKRRFQSKKSFMGFLPVQQDDSVVMASLGKLDSVKIGTGSTQEGTSYHSDIRSCGSDCACTATHSKSSWWLGPIGLPLQLFLGAITGLFIFHKWMVPMIDSHFDS